MLLFSRVFRQRTIQTQAFFSFFKTNDQSSSASSSIDFGSNASGESSVSLKLGKLAAFFFRQCRASDLTGGDRLEENPLEQKGKDDPDETSKNIRECHKAFLSSRDPKMLGMSEANQASSDALAADSGDLTRSD